MRPATCHPDRPYVARGLCRACYRRQWRRASFAAKRLARLRPCAVCSRPYCPPNDAGRFCSQPCRNFHAGYESARRNSLLVDQYLTTHDCEAAARLVVVLRDRGMRRVYPTRPCVFAREGGPYFSAWRRSHADGELYVVRYWTGAAEAGDLEEAA